MTKGEATEKKTNRGSKQAPKHHCLLFRFLLNFSRQSGTPCIFSVPLLFLVSWLAWPVRLLLLLLVLVSLLVVVCIVTFCRRRRRRRH